MKTFLLLVFVVLSTNLHAKNYYVSATGNDTNNGLATSTPWKTIAKVNSFNFAANDYILFKRGDTFYGGIILKRANLYFDAYGSGAKPVITGLSKITGWVNLGGNIWEAPTSGVKVTNNLVLRDGRIMQVGRFPNANAANVGYLILTAATSSSLTGPALSSVTNWTGAEVAIRINRWDIIRQTVTAHSGGLVTFTANPEVPRLNYGYFFQRDSRTLDQDGEWWQDGTNNKLRMYFSNNNPGAYSIQASTIDTLLTNQPALYSSISITNISFTGAGRKAIFLRGGSNYVVKNVDVRNTGADGITIVSATNVIVDGCNVSNSLATGVYISNNSNSTLSNVTNCLIDSTALLAGMEMSNDIGNSGSGITCRGLVNVNVLNNRITNSGYNGINWYGSNANIKYNLIDRYCSVRDDGAGIYTSESQDTLQFKTRYNRNVVSNICVNAIGQAAGTESPLSSSARGLYSDNGSMNIIYDSNTVAYATSHGFHGNGNRYLTMINNTVFQCGGASYSTNRLGFDRTIIGLIVKKNIFYPYRLSYGTLARDAAPVQTTLQDLKGIGIIDSNYYSLRAGTDTSLKTVSTLLNRTGYIEQNLPFSYLAGTVGIEKNSINVVNTGVLEYNASNTPKAVSFSGLSKKDVFGNVYNNSVIIPAWGSKILIPNGLAVAPNVAPVADAGINIVITLPTNIATLTGSGRDTDGIITSYKWLKIAGPVAGNINSPTSAVTSVNSIVEGVYLFELTVQDDKGAIAKDTVKLTVNAAVNQPPVAEAGANQIINLPLTTTTLTGTGIDFDGTIASYTWVKIAGPNGGDILSPNSFTTIINSLEEGEFYYKLSVTDNNGAVSSDTILIKVDAAINLAPVAHAGSNQVVTLPINSTLLKGTATDNDGSIISYYWVKVLGPAQGMIASPDKDSTTISNLEQGTYIFELTVTDNQGAISSDIVQITVNAGTINTIPIANAGINQVVELPINNALLTGIGTDTDGTIASYKWAKISGPGFGSISLPNAAVTTVEGLVQGIYQYRLTVTDNDGAFASDTVNVTVNAAPNKPPVANAGTDISITLPSNSTAIAGTGTDVDGTIFSYNWVKIAGPVNGTITSPNSATSAVNDLVQGVYKFELTVVDDKGAASKDSVEVKVNSAINEPPVADAGADQIITLPINTTTLNGIGIDFDGTIVNFAWVKITGPNTGNILSPNSAATIINNLGIGIFQFELSVTDNKGAITRDTIRLTVNKTPNQAPIANAGSNQVITLPINNISLNGSGADVDGTVVSYSWIKLSGPASVELVSPNSASTQVNNLIQGFYEFELTVMDNDGLTSTDTLKVTVNDALNKAPVAIAGANIIITLPTNSYSLIGSGTDEDGFITIYSWKQIFGTSQTVIVSPDNASTIINSLKEGIYKFELTVTDNKGAVSKDVVQVTVNQAPNEFPFANAGIDKIIVLPINNSTLTGIGTDADGTIASYKWVKISGTAGGTITSINSATTTINNLVQGANQYQFSVTDNKGAVTKDTIKITVNAAPNLPPVANAGADKIITLPINNTTLTGAGSDTDGTIVTYAWVKIKGAVSVTIASSNSAITSVSNLQQGVYEFTLTVTDNDGLFSKDTVKITVNPAPNQAPIANAGNNQTVTLPANQVNLNGSGTDADGTITGYTWVKISGPFAGTILSPNTPATQVNDLEKGVYVFEFTVKDNLNGISKDTIRVTVNPALNKPPVAEAGVNKVITLPVNNSTLSGTGTDTDGTIVSYLWKQIAGPKISSIVSPINANTIINNLIQGVYRYELTVTDNNGATGKDIVQITVNAVDNVLPIAVAGMDKTITLPVNTISLTGSGTDVDGTITRYKWLKIFGAASGSITSPNSNNTTITNLAQGVYHFQLTVTDNNGGSAKDTMKVIVNAAPNEAPFINVGIDKIITLPTNFHTLAGIATDADGTISDYTWVKISGPVVGEITSPNSITTAITNLVQGVYQFQLTVTDNKGATAKDTIQVTVNAAPTLPPVANAGPDKIITLPVNYTTLTGSGTDADGVISSYTWTKVSGPAAGNIVSQNSGTTIINNLTLGVYQYLFTVKDNDGAIGKDTIQVTVNKTIINNQIPVADAGDDIDVVLPVNDAKLKGKGTDTDGNIVVYSWRVIDGPMNYFLATPAEAETNIENLFQGVYQLEFTVTDNSGAIAKDTMQLTVSSPRLSNITYASNEFKVYPNPVHDIANISITTINAHTKVYLALLDLSGKLVITKEFVTAESKTFLKVDMHNFTDGYYILVLKFDDGRMISTKIIKNSST